MYLPRLSMNYILGEFFNHIIIFLYFESVNAFKNYAYIRYIYYHI